jgi:hypothetical protein
MNARRLTTRTARDSIVLVLDPEDLQSVLSEVADGQPGPDDL